MQENQKNPKKEEQKNTANQKENGQQTSPTKWKSKLFGIIILLIAGFLANFFAGDSGKETGQNNYSTPQISITPELTKEAQVTPKVSGELAKEDTKNQQEAKNDPSKTDTELENNGKDNSSVREPSKESEKDDSTVKEPNKESEENDSTVKEPSKESEENDSTVKEPSKESGKNNSSVKEPDKESEKNDAESEENGEEAGDEELSDPQDEVEILYEFRRASYLEQHFEKHGNEFEYATKEEYLAGANRVIQSPDALHKIEAEDGDDIYYLEETNEFVVVSTDGYIRTYFRPSAGIAYYNRQ